MRAISLSVPPAEYVAAVRERVSWCTATAEALGGAVRVTIAPGGALIGLDLTRAALERGAVALGAAVLEAAREATRKASAEFAAFIASVLGKGSGSVLAWLPEPGGVLGGHLPEEAARYVDGVIGHGNSPNGEVRATVGPAGALIGLQISPGALDAAPVPGRIAAAIRAAVTDACRAAAREVTRRRQEAGPAGPVDLDGLLARASSAAAGEPAAGERATGEQAADERAAGQLPAPGEQRSRG